MIDDLIVESGTDRDAFKKYYKIENVKELSASRFAEAVDFLKRKIEGGKDDK
jgi:vacuolar-type H+-ATPase subunit C/Vma6